MCATDELDSAVVLVRPEVRHGREARARRGTGERVLRGVHRLLDRVGPMLDSRRIAVPPVCDPGHVAGRIHLWRGGTGAVADDAIVEREAAAFEPLRVWSDPDSDHHHLGVYP